MVKVKKEENKIAIRKIVLKKLETCHISARKRKVPMVKVMEFYPRSIKNPGLFFSYSMMRSLALIIILTLGALSLNNIGATVSYYNDSEASSANSFTAGSLDFVLDSPAGFSPFSLEAGESSERTINIINYGNNHKYSVKPENLTGELCDYLNLEANLDGEAAEYSGKLVDFNYGPVIFEEPESWFFVLTLPADVPEEIKGKTCQFNFIFFGSQTKNNLAFGMGFNDTEEEVNSIASKICFDTETRSKGYWKNHESVYLPHLPQSLGDEIISTEEMVNQIFDDYNLSMRNKLKGQLLAMKFNVARFGMGEYLVGSVGKTVNQIINEADELLRQNPAPTNEVLEVMKNLLDGLNQDLRIRVCSSGPVPVIEPELQSSLMMFSAGVSAPLESVSENLQEQTDEASSTEPSIPEETVAEEQPMEETTEPEIIPPVETPPEPTQETGSE